MGSFIKCYTSCMSRFPHWKEERLCIAQGYSLIAGIDEVGCGCWAGPVFAGCIILPIGVRLPLIRDSKLLSDRQRRYAYEHLREKAVAWSIGRASEKEIDHLNIRRASGLAMQRAIHKLSITPTAVLSDAFRVPNIKIYNKNIIKGDRKVISIAAASIMAKVERDTYMIDVAEKYPEYGFEKHKGYGTAQHKQAITLYGITPIHRLSFKPIRNHLTPSPACL